MTPDDPSAQWRSVTALAVGLCIATTALVGSGYIATRGWVQSATSVVEGRASDALALVGVALNRDMMGAWTTVLVPTSMATIDEDPPYTLRQSIARAFATFPYPESFVVWRASDGGDGATRAFNRTERWPAWDHSVPPDDPFPVAIVHNPAALEQVVAALRKRPPAPSGFVSIDATIDGVPYQLVAHSIYATSQPQTLLGIAAFTVNMDWFKREYFGPLLAQIARIGNSEGRLWFSIIDDRGATVATTSAEPPAGREFERHFDLLFLNPALVSGMPRESAVRQWTIKVRPRDDLLSGLQRARGTFVVIAVAGVLVTAALLLTLRAVRARAVETSMKSDFVSEATHELKTPLALIRLVADTLAGRRYSSQAELQEYAGLLSQEAGRLSESINNLLTYARYGDPSSTSQITVATASLSDLVEAALERFRPTLTARGFDLDVDVPADIRLMVDTRSIIQVFESLIDNAIKYSRSTTASLHVTARRDGRHVVISFADRGIGIPDADIPHVFNRFYRAHNATAVGSGLGLTIVRSIVRRHGGTVTLRSKTNVGTAVDIRMKVAPPV